MGHRDTEDAKVCKIVQSMHKIGFLKQARHFSPQAKPETHVPSGYRLDVEDSG